MHDRMRKLLEDAAASNGRLQAIRKRMEHGKATFADTAEYSELLSDLLGEIFAHHVDQLTKPMEKETICKQLLQEHYESINKALAKVQQELDAQREIHIRPQQAAFPAERVQKVAHALEDPTVSIDTIRRRANAPVANVAKSFHDDYIKENAKFRADAGLKCWIVRTTDGKCCKWCTQVAGRYEYGTEPEDVYRRHDNCGCTTIYENGRQRQDVWSKKQWEVPAEGAGAKKPTILTPAHGRALQTKHKPTVLTKGSRSGIIELPDIQIGRSLGAKSKNYDILDPQTGEIFHLVEGSRLQNVEVFAGKGTRTSLHDGVAEGLTEQYGGQIGNWQHVKGHGIIDYYGDEIGAEIHWFQEDSVGRVKFKVKRWDE